MFTGLWVAEALGETKVNYVDVVLLFANSDQEVVWFDISVQEMTRMDKFNALKLKRVEIDMVRNIQNSLIFLDKCGTNVLAPVLFHFDEKVAKITK